MRRHTVSVLALAVLLLAGCAKPVPPEKAAYVGEWKSPTMSLLIAEDGSVAYKRLKQGVTTSITGPLRRFDGDDFVVGIPLLSTTFDVSKPPYQEGGHWKMVVDGMELTKVDSPEDVYAGMTPTET